MSLLVHMYRRQTGSSVGNLQAVSFVVMVTDFEEVSMCCVAYQQQAAVKKEDECPDGSGVDTSDEQEDVRFHAEARWIAKHAPSLDRSFSAEYAGQKADRQRSYAKKLVRNKRHGDRPADKRARAGQHSGNSSKCGNGSARKSGGLPVGIGRRHRTTGNTGPRALHFKADRVLEDVELVAGLGFFSRDDALAHAVEAIKEDRETWYEPLADDEISTAVRNSAAVRQLLDTGVVEIKCDFSPADAHEDILSGECEAVSAELCRPGCGLADLDLSGNQLIARDCVTLMAALNSSASIKRLCLSGNRFRQGDAVMAQKAADALVAALEGGLGHCLECLELAGAVSSWIDEDVRHTDQDDYYCSTQEWMDAVSRSGAESLQERYYLRQVFEVEANVKADWIPMITAPICSKDSVLQHLDLSYNNLRGAQVNHAIQELIARSTSLVHLDLSGNLLGQRFGSHIEAALRCNRTLLCLKINGIANGRENIGGLAVRRILGTMRDNATLQHLELGDNEPWELREPEIDALSSNSALQYLNIRGVRNARDFYGDVVSDGLERMIKANQTLQYLAVDLCLTSLELYGSKLVEATRSNTTLYALDGLWTTDGYGEERWKEICQNLERNAPSAVAIIHKETLDDDGTALVVATSAAGQVLSSVQLCTSDLQCVAGPWLETLSKEIGVGRFVLPCGRMYDDEADWHVALGALLGCEPYGCFC